MARLSEVTELRMLECGRSPVFVTETMLRSQSRLLCGQTYLANHWRNKLFSGGSFHSLVSVVQHVGAFVLFSCVLTISWMESRTSSMGFLICQSQTRPFTTRTRSPSITLDMGMRKVRQAMGHGTSNTSCLCFGKKMRLGIRK